MSKKAKKLRNYIIYVSIFAGMAIFITSDLGKGMFLNTLVAFGYGGGVPLFSSGTTSPAPSHVSSANTPLSMTTYQGGVMNYSFSGNNQLGLDVGEGTIIGDDPVTFFASGARGHIADLLPLLGGYNIADAQSGKSLNLLGNYLYTVSARDRNNLLVNNFNKPIKISLTIPTLMQATSTSASTTASKIDTSDIGAYYLDPSNQHWLLIPERSIDTSTGIVSFSTRNLTTFAVFKVSGLPNEIQTNGSAARERMIPDNSSGQILKIYKNGTLLKGQNGKIYIIVNQAKKYISTLAELRKYGRRPIYLVSDEILARY